MKGKFLRYVSVKQPFASAIFANTSSRMNIKNDVYDIDPGWIAVLSYGARTPGLEKVVESVVGTKLEYPRNRLLGAVYVVASVFPTEIVNNLWAVGPVCWILSCPIKAKKSEMIIHENKTGIGVIEVPTSFYNRLRRYEMDHDVSSVVSVRKLVGVPDIM